MTCTHRFNADDVCVHCGYDDGAQHMRPTARGHEPECTYRHDNVDWDKGIQWGGRPCICEQLQAAYLRGYLSALLEARDCLSDPDPAASIADMLADLAHP